jgi:hypothetical protein
MPARWRLPAADRGKLEKLWPKTQSSTSPSLKLRAPGRRTAGRLRTHPSQATGNDAAGAGASRRSPLFDRTDLAEPARIHARTAPALGAAPAQESGTRALPEAGAARGSSRGEAAVDDDAGPADEAQVADHEVSAWSRTDQHRVAGAGSTDRRADARELIGDDEDGGCASSRGSERSRGRARSERDTPRNVPDTTALTREEGG